MKFTKAEIDGAWIIEPTLLRDDRGFFCETWTKRLFSEHGINGEFKQGNLSQNHLKGTLRGLHYQKAPAEEEKLVRVPRGSIFDVMVDLRPKSPTYGRWQGIILDDKKFQMVYIPHGCAHGYQTLEDQTYVSYEVTEFYTPESASGIAWDDKTLNIVWPACPNRIISPKDMKNPGFGI